jgi:hypothetical protein
VCGAGGCAASGLVAPATSPESFLSGGVNLGRFGDGVWYELPGPLAQELAELAGGLGPPPVDLPDAGASLPAERSSRWVPLLGALGGLALVILAPGIGRRLARLRPRPT